jgi:VIT1/CCC1 family predicted Fe2+/Mn2+ transporter
MLASWKTTVAGLLLALSGLYNAVIENKPIKDTLWQFVAAVGLISSRDHDK